MFGIFRRLPTRGRIRLLKSELRRAIREKAAVAEARDRETERAADLADELEEAWRDRDRLRLELCDALCDRDRALEGRDDARERVELLEDDALADAARIARLEGELAAHRGPNT